jgi:hypothetical protein
MSIWDTAGRAIDCVFADDSPILYTGAGLAGAAVAAIRSEFAAPDFAGPGKTLRTIVYEVAMGDLPMAPARDDHFVHRDRLWSVIDITERADIGKWELIVTDNGASS